MLVAVVAMSLDSLWSAPVSVGSDQLASEAATAVAELQLSSGVITNKVFEMGEQRQGSLSDAIVPGSDSQSSSVESVKSPVAHVSASQTSAKPPNHTPVHGRYACGR